MSPLAALVAVLQSEAWPLGAVSLAPPSPMTKSFCLAAGFSLQIRFTLGSRIYVALTLVALTLVSLYALARTAPKKTNFSPHWP